MTKIGYMRVSCATGQEAGYEGQRSELVAAGCKKIFEEKVSSMKLDERAQLDAALDALTPGDTLVVTKLDRLCRSTKHLLSIVSDIRDRDAELVILDMKIDTETVSGQLILTIMGAIAEFERSQMLARQKVGIAKAKAEGRFRGRSPKVRNQLGKILELKDKGLAPAEIAKVVGAAQSSVYRILAENKMN